MKVFVCFCGEGLFLPTYQLTKKHCGNSTFIFSFHYLINCFKSFFITMNLALSREHQTLKDCRNSCVCHDNALAKFFLPLASENILFFVLILIAWIITLSGLV